MTGIRHSKISIIADDPSYDIQPTDWNADHVLPDSIPNVLSTATSDMLFGAAGKWVKKTLAEAKLLLGIPLSTADNDMLFGISGAWTKKTRAEAQVILHPNQLIGGVWHKQLWVAGFKPKLTNGCAAPAQIEMSTNKNIYDYLAFDKDAIEYAYANVPMPSDYTGGVIYFKPYWLHPATTTNFKVSWGLDAVSFANDDALDAAVGTTIYVNDEGGTTSDLYVGAQSSAVTIAGTPAAGELVNFRASRKADDGTNDTLAVDAYLLGFMIWYPVA